MNGLVPAQTKVAMQRPRILLALCGLFWVSVSEVFAVTPSPVVIELFESQGCSSCPPAERVMQKLRETFGTDVILLTFHVDYWDYLGWKDTFSDSRFTERQKAYGRAFGQDSIYTPEMVIQGERGFVGSDLPRAISEIRARQIEPRPPLNVHIVPLSSSRAQVTAQLPPSLVSSAEEITVVVYENAEPIHVLRGENRGETMSGDFAVRTILKKPVSSSKSTTFDVEIDPHWNRAKLRVAVLVRGDSSKIIAAAQTSL
jgi:hypothetical protein